MTYEDLPLFRATDPDTSKAAAQSVQKALKGRLYTLLCVYSRNYPEGLTDEQACAQADMFVGGWKRCSDLRRLGYIKDTGERRLTSSGRMGIVCQITGDGIKELRRG